MDATTTPRLTHRLTSMLEALAGKGWKTEALHVTFDGDTDQWVFTFPALEAEALGDDEVQAVRNIAATYLAMHLNEGGFPARADADTITVPLYR